MSTAFPALPSAFERTGTMMLMHTPVSGSAGRPVEVHRMRTHLGSTAPSISRPTPRLRPPPLFAYIVLLESTAVPLPPSTSSRPVEREQYRCSRRNVANNKGRGWSTRSRLVENGIGTSKGVRLGIDVVRGTRRDEETRGRR